MFTLLPHDDTFDVAQFAETQTSKDCFFPIDSHCETLLLKSTDVFENSHARARSQNRVIEVVTDFCSVSLYSGKRTEP
jgi:hypothetical protein